VNGQVVWLDDCEAPGDNGWMHPGVPPTGQTGVTFVRGQFGIDFWTNRPPMPGEPPVGTWMYAAVDTVTSRMVDGQRTFLRAPPIDIEGAASGIIGQWWFWADCPHETNDLFGFVPHSGDHLDCVWDPIEDPFGECSLFWWYTAAPAWWQARVTSEWSLCVGGHWFGPEWGLQNDEPPAPGVQHWAGFFLDRARFGYLVPTAVPDREPVASGLSAVLPNPSRGSTRITYSLLAASAVNVAVYDLTGRVVRTLVDGVVGPGEHEVVWDGVTETGVRAASGVYFVKLAAGDGGAGEAKLVFVR